MNKKLFVVDTDKDFQNQVKTLCPPDQVEIHFYSTSMEIFSLIGKEKPLLIFLNLDLPDLSDFVMFDLLKKTDNIPIPVLVTYSNQTEKDLQQYKKLKFQAKGYYRKPLANDELYSLLENYLELEEDDDDDDFSDENIDRLVRGELADDDTEAEDQIIEKPGKSQDETKDNLDIKIAAEAEPDEIGADIFIEEPGEKKISPLHSDLQDQEISLQRQNENLRSQNKTLSNAIESLKTNIEKRDQEIRQLKSELNEKKADGESAALKLENQNSDLIKKLKTEEKEKSGLQLQINELTNQLTDKERELAARNHEFEKCLKNKADELVQAAEVRLLTEFREKERQFQHDLAQLKEEKEKIQDSLDHETERIGTMNHRLQDENNELKKREDSLNRTISTLAEEKVTLSERAVSLEEFISEQRKELVEKEREHEAVIERHNQEMTELRKNLDFHKNRLEELGEILQNALSLTRKEH